MNHSFFIPELTLKLTSPEATFACGQKFGSTLSKGSLICFYGELGAGKTTFIKGLANGVFKTPFENVTSPTFVYLNIYSGNPTIYHFDLYRLKSVDDFLAMGFEDYLFSEGICCIEWPERIYPLIKDIPNIISVRLNHSLDVNGNNIRLINIKGHHEIN